MVGGSVTIRHIIWEAGRGVNACCSHGRNASGKSDGGHLSWPWGAEIPRFAQNGMKRFHNPFGRVVIIAMSSDLSRLSGRNLIALFMKEQPV